MKNVTLLISFLTLIAASSAYSSVIDAPHNETHGVTCGSCHSYSLWWMYSPAKQDANLGHDAIVNGVCASCHDAGGPQTFAKTHSSAAMEINPSAYHGGSWEVSCSDCHNPHYQDQLDWRPDSFLVEGVLDDNLNSGEATNGITHGADTSTIAISHLTKEDTLDWPAGNWSELIFVLDADSSVNTYSILSATATEIVVQGIIAPAMVKPGVDPDGAGPLPFNSATANTFGLLYGQLIRSEIVVPYADPNVAANKKAVKFFTPNGGFVDANNEGVCQVCHTQTNHYRNDDSAPGVSHADRDSTNCTSCHTHDLGFKGAGGHDASSFAWGGNCATCHAPSGTNGVVIADLHTGCGSCHVSAAGGGALADGDPANGVDGSAIGGTNSSTCITCHPSTAVASRGIHHISANNYAANGDCVQCHADGSDTLVADHSVFVADNSDTATLDSCATSGCHDGNVGLVTGAPVNPNVGSVHDACTTCHDANGDLKAAYGRAPAMPAGGGQCSVCHTDKTGAHTVDHINTGNVTLPTSGNCSPCHNAMASMTTFTSASDNAVHDGCATCHNTSDYSLRTDTGRTLAAGDCSSCHADKDNGTTLDLFAHEVDHTATNRVTLAANCAACHAATVAAPFTDTADNGKHDSCATCHTSATDLSLRANAGRTLSAGDCTACHNDANNHQSDHNVTVYEDGSVPETNANIIGACAACHDNFGGSNFSFISTAHVGRSIATADITGAAAGSTITCDTCHATSVAVVVNAIADGKSGLSISCADCHGPRPTPHGGHPTPDTIVVKNANCTVCHENNPDSNPQDVVADIHNNQCSNCHTTPPVLDSAANHPNASAIIRGGDCESCHGSGYNHDNDTHSQIVFGNDGGSNAGCTGCHDANPMTEHMTLRGWSCEVCHQSPCYDDVINTAITTGSNVFCTDCHTDQTFPHGDRSHTIEGALNCATCHSDLDVVNGIHIPGNNNNTCDTCHASGSSAVQNVIASGGGDCEDCHGGRYQHNTVGGHSISASGLACGSCHTSGNFSQVVDLHRDTCDTCHSSSNSTIQNVIASGGNVVCTDCHNGTAADTHHTGNARVAAGDCTWCHADPRPSMTNSTPGDNGGNSNYPTQLACAECHVNFSGSTMQVRRIVHNNENVNYTNAPSVTTIHSIPGVTAGEIYNYGMCFSCHNGSDALSVPVYHAKPTWNNPPNTRCNTNNNTPGIGTFNLFYNTWNGGKDFYNNEPNCSNDDNSYRNPAISFSMINVPSTSANGNTSGSVPVLPAVGVPSGSDAVTITQAWWIDSGNGLGNLSISATSTGASVSLSYSGSNLPVVGNHYERVISGVSRPNSITVSSSGGGSATLTVTDRTCTTCGTGGEGAPTHPIFDNITSGDCANCHSGQLDNEHQARGVSCTACHGGGSNSCVPPEIAAVVAMGINNPSSVTCDSCHGVMDHNGQHDMPAFDNLGANCATCHAAPFVDEHLLVRNNGRGWDCDTCHADSAFATAIAAGQAGQTVLCSDCHNANNGMPIISGHWDVDHGAQGFVLANTASSPATASCVSCHNTGDLVTGIHATNGCLACHVNQSGGLPLQPGAVVGGGECTVCHSTYFNNHGHHDSASNQVSYNASIDTSQPSAQGCADCHHDYDNSNSTSQGLSNWATIIYEHDVRDGNQDGSGACIVCHDYDGSRSAPLAAVQGAIAGSGNVTCATCHSDKVPDVAHGGHGDSDFGWSGNCATCHSGTNIVNDIHKGDCGTCHVNSLGGGTLRSGASGSAVGQNFNSVCAACHTASAESMHHNSNYTAVGECEWCHADPRSNWGSATPGDNGSNENYPTQMPCVECHVSFSGSSMTVSKYTRSSTTNYSSAWNTSTIHTIPNTAGQINNFGICFSCHGEGSALNADIWHARPNWSLGSNDPSRASCNGNQARYAPGRSSSGISGFNLFAGDYNADDQGNESDKCSNELNNYNNTNLNFQMISVPGVSENGGSSASVPIFPAVTFNHGSGGSGGGGGTGTGVLPLEDFESYVDGISSPFGDWIAGDTGNGSMANSWMTNSGSTPSGSTGPSGGAGGSSEYVYLETSSGEADDDNRDYYLESDAVDGVTYATTLSFAWNMNVNDNDDATLWVTAYNGNSWQTVQSITTGNSGDSWNTATVDLSSYDNADLRVRIMFSRGSGASYRNDVGLDNLEVSGIERSGGSGGGGEWPPANTGTLTDEGSYWDRSRSPDRLRIRVNVGNDGGTPTMRLNGSGSAVDFSCDDRGSGEYRCTVEDNDLDSAGYDEWVVVYTGNEPGDGSVLVYTISDWMTSEDPLTP